MALIPPDAGLRLRLQNDASTLQPTTPVHEIPADLPELRTGQVFSARIQEVMPENTYKALVAGKQITLQLPEGAKPGDSLELVVVDRTPRMVVARMTEQTAGAAANEPYQYATLSRTGQMLSSLLLQEGETPQPALLNRGEPLLPRPPTTGAEFVPALQKAITQSGLFYESHQAQWVVGKLPIEQLLQEPQGRRSDPNTLARQGGDEGVATDIRKFFSAPALDDAAAGSRTERRAELPATQQSVPGQTVPEELRPIVQQQLDAVATQRLLWHGEAWPAQPMEWEIVREDEQGPAAGTEEEMAWRTTLRLDTPRLGHVAAALRLTNAGLQMTLTAPGDTAAADLQTAAPALAQALESAGVRLLSFQVKHGEE